MERRPIPGYPYYQISDAGQIYSAAVSGIRVDGRRFARRAKIRKTTINSFGYEWVALFHENGRRWQTTVHRLVLEAFGFPRPSDSHFVNHKNGIKADNRLENLEWVTPVENMRHAATFGLVNNTGSNNPSARLSESDVIAIRHLLNARVQHTVLAEAFCVSRATIQEISSRKTWKHVVVERHGDGRAGRKIGRL